MCLNSAKIYNSKLSTLVLPFRLHINAGFIEHDLKDVKNAIIRHHCSIGVVGPPIQRRLIFYALIAVGCGENLRKSFPKRVL